MSRPWGPHEGRDAGALDRAADRELTLRALTAAVATRLVDQLGGRSPTSAELDEELAPGVTVADVLKGRVKLDVQLLVELEELFGVGLWPTPDQARRVLRRR